MMVFLFLRYLKNNIYFKILTFIMLLKKYTDFIYNKLDESIDTLLLESNVIFSSNFRKLLSRMENPVATTLLSVENKDLPVSANYFDIDTKRNDYLFFTPDRKAQEILNDPKVLVRFIGNNGGWLKHTEGNNSIFEKLGYVPGAQVYVPNNADVGEIITELVSEKSGKTWCYVKFTEGEGVYNKEKLRIVDEREKLVWKSNRQDIKVGRSMNALITLANRNGVETKHTARDIENFVNLYKMQIDRLNDKFSFFEEVQGDDISYWYSNETYLSIDGTLGSSCMSSVPDNYFEPYVTSDRVSLVIYKSDENDEKIVGRALLWKLNDDKMFMDRIYTIHDSDVELFRQYAKENGWYTKRYNNSDESGNLVAPNGEGSNQTLICQIEKNIKHFPYLDTLKYYCPTTGLISNDSHSVGGGRVLHLESTEGDYYEDCRTCGGDSEIECSNCSGNGEVDCETCEGSGSVDDENGDSEECSDCAGTGMEECGECYSGVRSCPDCN
jgi:hypothetical protein